MSIPNYQQLLGPVLKYYSDGHEHELKDATRHIIELLKLTPDEVAERTSSGTPVISNRVSWTHTYLRHAGLIVNVRRGICVITPEGREVLSTYGEDIDNEVLSKFEGFRAFKKLRHDEATPDSPSVQKSESEAFTPEEKISRGFAEHNRALAEELLQELRKVEWGYFEKIVGDLLGIMGYGDVTVTRRTADGGIDAIVNEDALGLSKIYVQAKRYSETGRVNGKEIRDFVGAMDINGVTKGVFITTSFFHNGAEDNLSKTAKSVVLIDGETLAELMIDYGLGVTNEKTYKLNRLDSDYLQGE